MNEKHSHILELITKLEKHGEVIFLDSQMPGHPASQKSLLAAKPSAWIKAYSEEVIIFEKGVKKRIKGDPWEELKKFKNRNQQWLFGYFGYDLKNQIEDLESKNEPLIKAPDLFFMIPDILLEVDLNGRIRIIKGSVPEAKMYSPSNDFQFNTAHLISEEEYISKVKRAQIDIYEGEYYEINLSHPIVFNFNGDPLALYQAMRDAGPVPFGGYLSLKDFTVCCESPERFLKKRGKQLWSQPIKGTLPRKGMDHEEQHIEKLRDSEKEQAENLMIVDLVRNDLGRVAIKGSVKVSELFEIQSFETVHQMVSTVECEVDPEKCSISLIKACFPMGSMTGAPKIAAMKAIDAYENYKRGVYSGALGYIKPNGDFDFNVIIRTAIIEDDKLVYPVGGAITSDSDPKAEWEETLVKAKAITNLFNSLKKPE